MAEASLKLGGSWATKEGSLLGFNDQNGNYKPIPFDFTRATTATRVNRDGLIEEVQSGVPRIDFSGDGSLLLEPQRTNLIEYSEDFTTRGGFWQTFGNATKTLLAAVSPDGNNTAAHITGLNGDGTNDFRYAFSYNTANKSLTYSVYLKGSGTLRLQVSNGVDQALSEDITLTSDWKRHSVSGTFNSTSVSTTYLVIDDFIGKTATEYYIWGAQLEEGSYATSYIPTEGSAVTRNADTSDGGESNNFDSSTAVWFIDLERTGIQSGRAIYLANSSSVEQIRLHFDAPTEQIRFRDGKASFANIGGLISMGTSTRKKLALKIDGATLKVFADGSQIGSDYTRPTTFTIEKLIIADDAFKLYDMKFYQSALTDTELEELTTL